MRMTGALIVLFASGLGCGPSGATSSDRADAAASSSEDADGGPSSGDGGTLPECAEAVYDAEQAPAAMLVIIDRSTSMAENNKWTFAAQAIVAALDQDVFDAMHVGLYAAPSGNMTGPACMFNLPVACLAPPFPQIDLTHAGAAKSSDAAGVRRAIKDWLTFNAPDSSSFGGGTPLYGATEAALGALGAWPGDGARILLVVTDGSFSCNQFSARPGFADCNGCDRDWEDPRSVVDLVAAANQDADRPVQTFFVGVPGADTYDASGCYYPPYRMRLALSAMAHAGAPAHVPAGCDGQSFTPAGAEPTLSCHVDMTQGGFSAAALAETISYVRGEVLGCVFEMPEPPEGEVIDPDEVNVSYTADGVSVELARRADPGNPCTDTGCWDYTGDGRVELHGKACADVKGGSSVQVRIVVGCTTIIL
jgi:hypothetical protein